MGCGTCKSECGREDGCGERKAVQKDVLDALTARLYPSRTWGAPDDEACFRAGLGAPEVARLAQRLAVALQAPAYVQPGGHDDLCAFIYVLCLGRSPSLLELRAEGALGAALSPEATTVRERYLRVACSTVGRLACVQEVAMEMDLDPQLAQWSVIRELPQPGVFDPKLLKRFQKTVDLLMAHDVEHLDMGLLDVPAAEFGLLPGAYEERFAVPPALLNYLFYAAPVLTASVSYLPLSAQTTAALAEPAALFG